VRLKIPWKEVYYLGFDKKDYVEISEPELLFVIYNKPALAERLKVTVEGIIREGVKKYNNFWEIFFTVRDLIRRGYRCRYNKPFVEVYDKGIIPGTTEPAYNVYPISEGSILSWEDLEKLYNLSYSKKVKLLIGIVDWEGELTYYEMREPRI